MCWKCSVEPGAAHGCQLLMYLSAMVQTPAWKQQEQEKREKPWPQPSCSTRRWHLSPGGRAWAEVCRSWQGRNTSQWAPPQLRRSPWGPQERGEPQEAGEMEEATASYLKWSHLRAACLFSELQKHLYLQRGLSRKKFAMDTKCAMVNDSNGKFAREIISSYLWNKS